MMIGKEIINEKELPLVEVRLALKKRSEEGELNYEQKVSYDYVKEFGKSSSVKAKAALQKLEELGIPIEQAVKIIDVQPNTKEELGLIFEKIKFDVESNYKKILLILKEL